MHLALPASPGRDMDTLFGSETLDGDLGDFRNRFRGYPNWYSFVVFTKCRAISVDCELIHWFEVSGDNFSAVDSVHGACQQESHIIKYKDSTRPR